MRKTAADWARTRIDELAPGRRDNGALIARYLDNFDIILALLVAYDLPRKRRKTCQLLLLPKDLIRALRDALVVDTQSQLKA